MERFLARHTTASLEQLTAGSRGVIALVPVGSTEPHGPHLGLGTDVVISAAACLRACELLDKRNTMVGVIAPAVSYGVTECATGFQGAVSIPAAVLTQYLEAVIDG
ncbi:MAG TPA: creatininase family protein, partial [Kofleriaceae bacterium]